MTPETLPQHWLQHVKKYRGTDKVASRQKDLGIWQRFTWDQEYEHVRDFGLGLLELGLKRGDRVAIIGDNDREYLWGALAIMAVGATVVGIFTDVTPNEVEYVVNHSDATFVLAGDQEQCDKLLEIKEQVPRVNKVIYWDERGMWHYNDPWLMDFKDVEALGRAAAEQAPDRFDAIIAEGRGEDMAMFCYTSGTTGLPKGAMITHRNFIYEAFAFAAIDPRYPTDNFLSFIPMAWIGGAALDIGPHTTHGVILNFAESPETVQANIREIAPDSLLYNSRLWENLVAMIQVRMIDATWFNRMLYRIFLPIGYKVADYRLAKQHIPWHWRLLYQLGKLAIFNPMLSQFGLHKARTAYTSGAALSPDVIRFFLALGLPLRQIYGSTELTGGAVAHRQDDIKFESVGVPLPGAKMMISPEGEIYLTSDGLFAGYHKNPEATDEALYIDEKGVKWFRTGDAGYIDEDGHLIYLDRMKDMISLGSGDKYSPQYIEGRLKFSPYISHAMTIGDETKGYVTALITIDFDNVGRWAEKRGLAYTTYTDLSQKPEVYQLIREDIEKVNRTLPEPARVRKFALLHKEFDADEGEMTRTRKLRRRFLADRYSDIIDALYDGRDEVRVQATVKYRDGRVGVIDTTLRIQELTD
ncbi:MAG: long-chain fatty acid--CoA ligase [Chloroflexi bacterium]|nr:long-chain fatty acid--CoA ligase [Chloroflexota bacterium]